MEILAQVTRAAHPAGVTEVLGIGALIAIGLIILIIVRRW